MAHYRNARQQLEQYDIRDHVNQSELWDSEVDNRDAILQTLDRDLRNQRRFNVDEVVAFLLAASQPEGASAVAVPQSVPSGIALD